MTRRAKRPCGLEYTNAAKFGLWEDLLEGEVGLFFYPSIWEMRVEGGLRISSTCGEEKRYYDSKPHYTIPYS